MAFFYRFSKILPQAQQHSALLTDATVLVARVLCCNWIRNHAMERGFVVADADFPERRLVETMKV